jgi:hypothetical protein
MKTSCDWRALAAATLTLVASSGLSCAEHMANRAAAGATTGFQAKLKEADTDPTKQAARVAGHRAVAGALEEIDDPKQRERIRRAVDEAVSQAVASALATAIGRHPAAKAATPGGAPGGQSPAEVLAGQIARAAAANAIRKLTIELGDEGRLGTTLAGAGQRLSASVVEGASTKLADLVPGCSGPDAPACRERRLRELTHAAGAGFSSGIRDTLGWPLLIVAAALGGLAGASAHRLWTGRRRARQLRAA